MPAATTRMRATACVSFNCLSFCAVSLDHSALPSQPRQTPSPIACHPVPLASAMSRRAPAGYAPPGSRRCPIWGNGFLSGRHAIMDSRRTSATPEFPMDRKCTWRAEPIGNRAAGAFAGNRVIYGARRDIAEAHGTGWQRWGPGACGRKAGDLAPNRSTASLPRHGVH
jgi:hypothetical protein